MRRWRIAPAAFAGLAAFALLGLGCRGERGSAGPLLAWERVDLVDTPMAGKARKAFARRVVTLGPVGTRDLPRGTPPPSDPARIVPQASAGEVRALEQAAGSVARWRVALGSDGWLGFTPLRSRERPCDCAMTVRVVDGGENAPPREVARVAPGDTVPVAPAPVAVDLSAWAGRTVELQLAVDAPADDHAENPPRVVWASPALYSRKPIAAPPAAQRRPNVLVVGIDTLRADALGAWGHTPSVTPALDRLAAASDVFLDAYSSFNVTNPSFISLFTGLYGKHHGSYDLRTPLPASRTTLAEVLAAQGYDTAAILSVRHLRPENSGLGQGFAEVTLPDDQAAGELAVDTAVDWIGKPRTQPWFLWLHLFDPHSPYTPPRPWAEGKAASGAVGMGPIAGWTAYRALGVPAWDDPILGGNRELYAGETSYADRQMDRLLGWLESRGLLDSTLVVVVADHGESLGEHGIRFRHAGLWDPSVHVPLIVRWPGSRPGRRIHGLVQNVDVFPTILGTLGIPVPAQDGEDLRALATKPRRVVFSEHSEHLGVAVRTEAWKLFRSVGSDFIADGTYLYDLRRDPGETTNLAGQGRAEEKTLGELLDRWLADRPHLEPGAAAPQAKPLSPEEEQRLKSLGYL